MLRRVFLLFIMTLFGCSHYEDVYDFEPQVQEPEELYVPEMQYISMEKAYETAATRIANKMIDDTSDLYEKTPNLKIYVAQIKKISDNLPDGLYTARRALETVIGG